jgi:hypothetical protein
MSWYRFLISAVLIFTLGCASGPSPATSRPSTSSEFRKLCRATGAEGGKLEREKFIARAKDKEAAAKLFDACDTQHKGYLTEKEVKATEMEGLKRQVIRQIPTR